MKKWVQFALLISCCVVVSGCFTYNKRLDTDRTNQRNVMRVGSITGLRPEKADYYKKLHANTWPRVLKRIKDSNIRNYSIYLKKIEGKLYLFSYFEYVGDDFEGDMAKVAADATIQKWWKETDPCQLPLPEAKKKDEIWEAMEEVFHAD